MCQLHNNVALYIILSSIFLVFLAILLVQVTTHILFYHAVIWHMVNVSEPS